MKKLFGVVLILFCCASVQAQNIEGQIIASEYGRWKVPGYAANTFSAFAPDSCRVQGGASFFFAFTVGTPLLIVDSNPALTETVTPTSVVNSNVACAVSIAPVNNHQLPFSLTSATGGLQEALSQNLTNPQPNTVILDNAFYNQVGGAANVAGIIATVQGNAKLGLMDLTQVPTVWYAWNGTQYVKVGNGGVGTGLNTEVNDLVANNVTNTAAQDLYDFVATGPTVNNPQAAINAAAASNGSVILQPGVGRTPFTNPGNYRVQDNRADVPATARGVTEFGASCDLRQVYGTLTAGSTTVTIIDGFSPLFSASDVGRSLVAVGSVGGTTTQFESAIAAIINSNTATLTTAAPFTQSTSHQMDLGHDDTAAIAQGLSAVGGGGTLVFPAGNCLTHTQTLRGQSPIGLGINSQIVSFPGEDIFQGPDPSQGQATSQGAAHIHDLTFLVDGRIDATLPWQSINDSGTTAHAALYRPIAMRSGVTSNPVAPGWFQGPGANHSGAFNGVASITAASAVMCVPSAETAPAVGQTVVFPYLTTVFTATVASSAGSCSSSATARTLSSALPTGSTNAQAEWFAGSSPQNLATAISSGACPSSISLSNSISPAPGYEANVAPFGLIQIDGEQFTYFSRSDAVNPTPANTLYNIQCAQNGTARAAHSVNATVVPLNNFKPSYPWPVTPTLNSGDTTPSGTAGYFPGWNVGNAAFAFPLVTGINSGSGATGSWNANAKIENLSFSFWPIDINGQSTQQLNHTAMIYMVSPSYATTFSNLYGLYLFYGIAIGAPSIENGNYFAAQPTADGSHWDGITIYAANPVNIPLGNQNTFSNFNVYSQEGTSSGSSLGADTCFYWTSLFNDQTGGAGQSLSLDHFKNLYCEPESGPHAGQMPQWEWDTANSEIEDQHMGGNGEVYVGGAGQHWIGGNFNNSAILPLVNWGTGNTSDYSSTLGAEPKSNIYGASSLINYGYYSRFSGTTAQAFGSPGGPYGTLQAGNDREPIPAQTAETFFTGNLTAPYTSMAGGFITPEEFDNSYSFDPFPLTTGWTFDDTSPITHSYAGCAVGGDALTTYCQSYRFNNDEIAIGPDQRIVAGKYTMYLSAKDATVSSNSETVQVYSNCGSVSYLFTVPLTNAWPSTLQGYFSAPVDFSSATGSGCYLGLKFNGASSADTIEYGFIAFAPVAESLNVQTLNATTINSPTSPTGGSPTGCAQSPVTGINGGYSCPTLGAQTGLSGSQAASDTTATVVGTSGFSPSGCFFVDSEYECYTGKTSTTFTGITRGAYTTTATTHNTGAPTVGVSLVLGSVQQPPSTVTAYGESTAVVLGVNNGFPSNHSGTAALDINAGANETYFDTTGAMHQGNPSAQSNFAGSITVGIGPGPGVPDLSSTGYLLQTNGPNTAYSPLTFGGGHAGSLNVIATPTIGAPVVTNFAGSGSTTISYVCSGTDFDGNLIPGITASVTSGPATWAFPQFISVLCPWSAGVNTYQIYRTAGGQSQGLLASGVGPGFETPDFNGATIGGTPPSSNASNPHISVAGTGTPTIALGTVTISSGAGAPTSTCGTAPNASGSLWLRTDGGANTSLYSCAGTTWTAVTIP